MARSRVRGQSGQVTAMLVIFAGCLLLLIVAVTDLSSAYLRHQAAGSLADGAALAATEAARAEAVYRGVGYVPIDAAGARAAVHRYLAATGAIRDHPALLVQVRVVGHRVEVTVAMPYRLPVAMPGVRRSRVVRGFAAAEVPVY